MILEQKVKIKWNQKNKEYYVNKGYAFTTYKDFFMVDIKDLKNTSTIKIKFICDFCMSEKEKSYYDLIRLRDKSLSGKDCCSSRECSVKKMINEATIRQNKGLLKEGDPYYWYFESNRLKEVLLYAEEYGNLNNLTLTTRGSNINTYVNKYDGGLKNLLNKNNINITDFKDKRIRGYYDDFKNLEKDLNKLIAKYDRFPTTKELWKEGLCNIHLLKHGGIDNVKRLMNYQMDGDLIDDRGFVNSSTYEFIVAQFLIHNNISYERETHPFPENEKKYRSDFLIKTVKGEDVHVEIWGYDIKRECKINNSYALNKIEKKKLYEKYKINLIELEHDIFTDNTYQQINNELSFKFKDLLENGLKEIETSKFIPTSRLTDVELLEKVMSFSDNSEYLPKSSLRNANFSPLYKEVIKRYGRYSLFAEKFKKKTYRRKGYNYSEKTILQFERSI